MRRLLVLLFLPLFCALPVRAQDDLLAKVIAAHSKIQNATISAQIDVVGDVDFKGQQEATLWLARPKFLAWRSQVKLPTETLTRQVVADGKSLWVYDSDEPAPGVHNAYVEMPFDKDVMRLGRPEVPVSMGLHSIILGMIDGDRENVLGTKTLRIPSPTPDAQGECMFELVAEGKVDQVYVDAKTFLLKRLVALVEGKPFARAAITYKLDPPDPALFKFTPPPGSQPAPSK